MFASIHDAVLSTTGACDRLATKPTMLGSKKSARQKAQAILAAPGTYYASCQTFVSNPGMVLAEPGT